MIEPSFGHDKLKIQPVDMSRFLITDYASRSLSLDENVTAFTHVLCRLILSTRYELILLLATTTISEL